MHIQFVAQKFQTEDVDGMGQRAFHIGNNGRDKFVTDTVFEVRLEILVVKPLALDGADNVSRRQAIDNQFVSIQRPHDVGRLLYIHRGAHIDATQRHIGQRFVETFRC
jgi:hypothetical protein